MISKDPGKSSIRQGNLATRVLDIKVLLYMHWNGYMYCKKYELIKVLKTHKEGIDLIDYRREFHYYGAEHEKTIIKGSPRSWHVKKSLSDDLRSRLLAV